MKCLMRNKTTFYYATYDTMTALTDDDGNETGEYGVSYSAPIQAEANISQSTGRASNEQFGIDLLYDKVLVTDDMNIGITEDSILWIDNDPLTQEHDYIVKKIAKSINSISIALSKVDVR